MAAKKARTHSNLNRTDVRSFDYSKVHAFAPELGLYLALNGFATTVQIKRPGLTTTFHEAMGLDREIRMAEKYVKRAYRYPRNKGETEARYEDRIRTAVDEESYFLAHLQHSANHAASSIVYNLDQVVQTFAEDVELPTKWRIGGKFLTGDVTLIEGIRAVANWQRHHAAWKAFKESNWNHNVLKTLNLWTADRDVPVKFLKSLRCRCYRDLERHFFIAMHYMILEMGPLKGGKAAREKVEYERRETRAATHQCASEKGATSSDIWRGLAATETYIVTD